MIFHLTPATSRDITFSVTREFEINYMYADFILISFSESALLMKRFFLGIWNRNS